MFTDRSGQGEQALEVRVGAQEGEPDAELADPPLDGGLIPQEPDWRFLVRGRPGELDQVLHSGLRGKLDEPFLLVLCRFCRFEDGVTR